MINIDDHTTDPDELHAMAAGFKDLALYAEIKAAAMIDRAAGNIAGALIAERDCAAIYKRLPAWAKW